MKRIFCGLLLMIVLSGFAMAGSEISANFVVGGAETEIDNYVPAENFWSSYGGYVIGILAIFVIGYFLFKVKGKTITKRKKRKKVSRKVSKKKI